MTNPYQPPRTDFSNISATATLGEGSLERGVNGEYDFTVSEVFSEAWEKLNGAKGALWGGIVLLIIATVIGGMIRKLLIGDSMSAQFLGGLVVLPITGPLYMGLFMMGVRRAAGLEISTGDMFRYVSPYGLNIVIAQVMVYVATIVGFMLLIIPGVWAMVSFLFSAPLVADKGLEPWAALQASRHAIGHHWWKLFGFLIAMGFVMVFSAIPLGLGLIWTLPLTVIANGIVYRKIFGLTPDVGL